MPPEVSAAAIVLAGGSGSRLGAIRNKVFLPLGGRPVIEHSLEKFAGIGPVVLVVRAADVESAQRYRGAGVELVEGGATRQESELAGLRALGGRIRAGAVDVVLIHDGARPLASPGLVADVLRVAREHGGAVPGLDRPDLAVAGPDGTLAGPVDGRLVAVQTPQGFRARPLLAAYEAAAAAGFAGTDTASCVARFAPEVDVRVVPSDGRNLKITFPDDLEVARAVVDSERS